MSKKANRLLKRIGERFARPFLSKPKPADPARPAPPEWVALGGVPDIQAAEAVFIPANAVVTGIAWLPGHGAVVHTNNGDYYPGQQVVDGAAQFDLARLQQARLQLQAAANQAQFAQEMRGRGQVGMQVGVQGGPVQAQAANSMQMRGQDVFAVQPNAPAGEWWLPTDPKAEIVRIKQMVVDEETLRQQHMSGLRMDAVQYRSAPWEAQDRRDRLAYYVDGYVHGPANRLYQAFHSQTVKNARSCLEGDVSLPMIVEFALRKNHAIVINSSEYGRLISVPVCMGYRRVLYVHVKNSTPDKDGKYADYYIPVDLALRPITAGGFGEPQTEYTAKNAIASTFGLRGEDYDVRAAS